MSTAEPTDFYEEKYSEGHEIVRPYKRKGLELLPEGNGLALDVGCGTGEFSSRLAEKGYQPVGVDIATEALKKYQGRGFPGFKLDLNELALPFRSGTFNAVWFTEVLEHVEHPANLLSELFRVLEPGGYLILTTPNSYHLFYRILYLFGNEPSDLQHPEHINFFSKQRVRSLVTDADFRIERSLGRNLFGVVKESWLPETGRDLLTGLLEFFGFEREYSFKFDENLFIATTFSKWFNPILADDLIFRCRRPMDNAPTPD